MSIFIPIYCTPPNKLIRYELRRFDDGAGHTGIEKIAIFMNKKKQQCEMVAQIKWDDKT